jgi:hypothetical protein
MKQDLKFAARLLTRSPGWTAVAVLSLALGIGANTIAFSLVESVLLKPFPYSEPERRTRSWRHGFDSPNGPVAYTVVGRYRAA